MCGIIAIRGIDEAYNRALSGLMNLQHRGQDGAGILSVGQNSVFFHERKPGLISNNFKPLTKDSNILKHTVAIGHTRYSTVGLNNPELLQPFVDETNTIALAHNGNLVNFYELKSQWLENHKTVPVSDSMMILNLLGARLNNDFSASSFFTAVKYVMDKCVGGYAIVGALSDGSIFAFRDPNGLRPLILGQKSGNKACFGFASETLPLEFLGFDTYCDVEPGQAVFIDRNGIKHSQSIVKPSSKPCMFEWVYFARVESTIDNRTIYEARFELGVNLAKIIQANNISADVVCCVPETSRISALALAQTLNIAYEELLIKNQYINRTFILDSDKKRADAIKLKLFPIQSRLKGKDCIIVDDSIVRGTTASQIVQLLRQAGVRKVILASTCPPIISPCYYGIDFPDSNELLAYNKTNKEIATALGADEVIFQSIDGLKKSLAQKDLCVGCLTGKYPTSIESASSFTLTRNTDRGMN